MRTGAFVLAILMIASAPTLAAAKKAKAPKAKPPAVAAQPVDPNEGSRRLVRDSLPLFLPAVAQVIYFSSQAQIAKNQSQAAKTNAKKK